MKPPSWRLGTLYSHWRQWFMTKIHVLRLVSFVQRQSKHCVLIWNITLGPSGHGTKPPSSRLGTLYSRYRQCFMTTRQIWGIWKLRPAYSPESPIWVKIGDVLSRVTLKFDGWPWKTIGHLSFAVSSFVQHFIAIGEFKLELQSGNAKFGSNSTIFRAVWPWNLTYDLEKQ